MKYLISVIIPVYNCKKFLKRAVNSVINQKNFDFYEIILVDDGSTDGSADICDAYQQNYANITVIHQQNSGVSAARNSGLECAQGEWICFVDSDDYLLDDAFEKMLKFNDADLICAKHISNFNLEDNFDAFFEDGIYLKSDIEDRLNHILSGRKIFYPCWSRLYKNSIIKENDVKFPVGVKIAEDMIFVYTYLKYIKTIAFTTDEAYFYFVNDDNTTNVIPKSFDTFLSIYNWIFKYFNEIECDKELLIKQLNSAFVFSSFDSIKIATDALGFFDAVKYVSFIINNETFYSLYLSENYSVFSTITDELLNKFIINKNSFMICVIMLLNKLKTKIFNKELR